MPVQGIGKQRGRSSLVAIAAVLVIGVVLGAMILSKNRGSAQQDDAAPADKNASAQPAKSTPNEVPIDDAQAKAAGITIE